MDADSIKQVKDYLLGLQDSISKGLSEADGGAGFRSDEWQRAEGGSGRSRVLAEGAVLTEGAMDDIRRNPDVLDAYLGGGED